MLTLKWQRFSALLVLIGLVVVVCLPDLSELGLNLVLGGATMTAILLTDESRLVAITKSIRRVDICEVLPLPEFRLLRSVLQVGLPPIATGLLAALSVSPAAAPPLHD